MKSVFQLELDLSNVAFTDEMRHISGNRATNLPLRCWLISRPFLSGVGEGSTPKPHHPDYAKSWLSTASSTSAPHTSPALATCPQEKWPLCSQKLPCRSLVSFPDESLYLSKWPSIGRSPKRRPLPGSRRTGVLQFRELN